MKKWKVLRIVGCALGTVFGIDLAYIAYGTASQGHPAGEISWHIGWAIAMIALGIWLIVISEKKLKEQKKKDSLEKG